MIAAMKNNLSKRVCCPHCENILEYEIDDLMIDRGRKFYCYLPCPICGEEIIGDYFKALILTKTALFVKSDK